MCHCKKKELGIIGTVFYLAYIILHQVLVIVKTEINIMFIVHYKAFDDVALHHAKADQLFWKQTLKWQLLCPKNECNRIHKRICKNKINQFKSQRLRLLSLFIYFQSQGKFWSLEPINKSFLIFFTPVFLHKLISFDIFLCFFKLKFLFSQVCKFHTCNSWQRTLAS